VSIGAKLVKLLEHYFMISPPANAAA
jgi:hypothetical protein